MSGIRAVVATTTVMSEGTKRPRPQLECHEGSGPNPADPGSPLVRPASFLSPFAQNCCWVRSDRISPVRADIAAGPQASADRPRRVTYGDLSTVQPFGNVLMAFTMTGDMIKRLLEQQFDNPSPGAATILQVSSGFTYKYRSAAPAGQHVEADSIRLNGRRIGASDRIRVAASDLLVDGGDGFTVFGESTDRLAIVADIAALVEYFKARSPISPPRQDRIVRTD
jgi:2',3'-cyclic-nucleotide 2'-phosphodiesterase (5'-nucleotidase family)